MRRRGKFITLEGIDGSGKSTQLPQLVDYLKKHGVRLRVTCEPGGTRVGNQIRHVLLSVKNLEIDPMAELGLFYAARAQHVREVIEPALAAGQWVLSDRFSDASMAYQGYGRKLGQQMVDVFENTVCKGLKPDLTLVLLLGPSESFKRVRTRGVRRNSTRDRFEAETASFHRRVQAGYRAIARREPRRVKLIKASRTISQVQDALRGHVDVLIQCARLAEGR